MIKKVLIALLLLINTISAQNNPAIIREYKKVFTTYPFSDPNPIPVMGNIYPYFRFDGYADKPIEKEWKVVELENDYIKLMVLPEIGGKIWAAFEKSTGRSFIYYNHVVKFRDIAMRGPWTSGGIEPNYGIIGHTPNCATPVDYLTRVNDDGSVSCFIGTLDLLTRTNWRIEIKLEKDKAYLTTRSIWYNSTPIEQPYYTWMNTGLKANGNLEFIYPGSKYLGHGGEYASWSINEKNGKNINWYDQNNFGGYKSYHVFGKYTDFFGAYWHDDNFGMARYSLRDDKPGKKIWIWGLSQQGMIWENLLTDTDKQYVEVQSGRLFNQTAEQSTFTPFKHNGFAPYSFDTWTEYWFPVMNIKGFIKANNYGALNLRYENGFLKIYFSSVQAIHDELKITSDNKTIFNKKLELKPLQIFSDSIRVEVDPNNLVTSLGASKMVYNSNNDIEMLNRPVDSPKDFDWNSVYGLYLQGKENIREKNYESAETKLNECLKKDPNYLPALVDLSVLIFRRMKYSEALAFATKALGIDAYDGAANYYYGIINKTLGNTVDAKDGFEIASHSAEYRSASYIELAKIYFTEKNYDRVIDYANKSLDFNRFNLDAYQLLALVYQKAGDKEKATIVLAKLIEIDPLNYFSLFENYLIEPPEQNKKKFLSYFKDEMPQESFLELTAWYYSLNEFLNSDKLLELALETPEIIYWRAFIKNKMGDNSSRKLIEKANSLSPNLSFPFRSETAPILQWVISQTTNWKPKYYLGLIHWDRRNYEEANNLFLECGDESDYAPFYAARFELYKRKNKETAFLDLAKAIKLDPEQWRYTKILANYFIEGKQYKSALTITSDFYSKHKDNYIIGMLNAKSLLLNNQYEESIKLLEKLNILPYEGSTEGRQLWREANLMLALEKIKIKKFNQAISQIEKAKEWPVNLGAGKPYQEDIDERLEDWMEYFCYIKLNNALKSSFALKKIITYNQTGFGNSSILSLLAYKENGDKEKVETFLSDWEKVNSNIEIRKWYLNSTYGESFSISENLKGDLIFKILSELKNF